MLMAAECECEFVASDLRGGARSRLLLVASKTPGRRPTADGRPGRAARPMPHPLVYKISNEM